MLPFLHCTLALPVPDTAEDYLVAAENVDNNQHVGNCDQPGGVRNREHDVAFHAVAEGPVTGECHTEVAVGDCCIGQSHAPHVWLEGAVLDAWLGW